MMRTEQEKKQTEVLHCPECGKNDVVETTSDFVCRYCGLVLEQRFEADQFVENDSLSWKKNRFGSPESRRSKNTYFSSLEVAPGETRAQFHRMWFAEKNLEYDAIEENKSRLLSILTKIGFSSNQKNHILYELRKRYDEEKRKGIKVTNIFLIAASICIMYAKNSGMPLDIKTIVDVFKTHKCKISSKAVRDYIISKNLNYTTSSASVWVSKYLAKIRSDFEVRKMIKLELEAKAENEEISDLEIDKVLTSIEVLAVKLAKIDPKSRKSSVLSVACILLASKFIADRLKITLFSQTFLAKFCNVSPATLRSHLSYLNENVEKNVKK